MKRLKKAEPAESPPRRKSDVTKDKLLDALERIALRDGFGAVGVNAVAAEAGMAKTAVYRHFDDFKGMVRAWAVRSKIWSDDAVTAAKEDVDSSDRIGRLKRSVFETSTRLRANPILRKVMASELAADTEFALALREVKKDFRKGVAKTWSDPERYGGPRMSRLLLLLSAGTTYLALRSASDPNYFGYRLDTEKDWDEVLRQFEEIFDEVNAAANLQKLTKF